MPPRPRAGGRRRLLRFDPDPERLLRERLRFPGLERPEPPDHVVRLLRPRDLVALDVLAYGLRLQTGPDGPELTATAAAASRRLEVRFPFQHLGEIASYAIEGSTVLPSSQGPGAAEPGGPPPAQEVPGPDDPVVPAPVPAWAAYGTRLVYDVPDGERIPFSTAGILDAMGRLPLLVVPLATPRAVRPTRGELSDLLTLPGGLRLAVDAAGGLAVAAASGRRRTDRSLGASIAAGTTLRLARQLLAAEPAVQVGRVRLDADLVEADALAAGLLDRFLRPERILPRIPRGGPRRPTSTETAIEAPYRLVLSPSTHGGFAHATEPQTAEGDAERVELWHSRLGVRDDAGTVDETVRHPQRAVRAVWARDKEGAEPTAPSTDPFRMSLDGLDRVMLVRQSADHEIAPPQPVDARQLQLSSLGAWLDLHGAWDIGPYATAGLRSIITWDHEAPMGRDQFVQVVYPGYFYCLGHKGAIVKITERKTKEATGPQSRLYQRKFLVCTEPVKRYTDRRFPFVEVRLRPLVTPDIHDPLKPGTPFVVDKDEIFWPVVDGRKFRFTIDCTDWDGRTRTFHPALLFVAAHRGRISADNNLVKFAYTSDPEHVIDGSGQSVAYAPSTKPGGTSYETVQLRLTGIPGTPGQLTSTPLLDEADIIDPAMRHLTPDAKPITVSYQKDYVAGGFTGANADAQVFLALKTPASIGYGGGTDRSGGFVQPDLPIRGLSRSLGPVGDLDDLLTKPPAERFNPTKFLAGALPKLFGLFELTDILAVVGLDKAPQLLTEALDQVAALLRDLDALRAVVTAAVDRLADDAAKAATSKLAAQAEAARADLATVRDQLSPAVDDVADAVADLLQLDAPSSLADVTARLQAPLTTISTLVVQARAVVDERPLPPAVKAELGRLVAALGAVADVTATLEDVTRFVNGLDPTALAVRARYDWRPELTNFPKGPDDKALFRVPRDGLLISLEARASGQDGVGVDVLAELRDFSLNLFPSAPLLKLAFDRLSFRSASGGKPEVDVVFRGIEFVGVLSFIETLRDLIPFDGFADPPYVDVSPDGARAGFDLALPNVAVGVFALENISLGADARIPFLGTDAVTVGFYFCTREKPFRLTVMFVGGGGFVGIRLSPKGLVLLEMALEAGASLSVNLGIASGSVSVMIGVYLRLESQKGSLTGYFRIRGEVDVLGLISASITLELSLTYHFDSGKMVGRATLTIQVEIFLLSFSVSVTVERQLAGSNEDPTFGEQIGIGPGGESPAWDAYCAAFAEE